VPKDIFLDINKEDFEKKIETQNLRHKQKLENKNENVKHFIAGAVILSYIFLLFLSCIWKFKIPIAYETLALIVMGYYFAKHF